MTVLVALERRLPDLAGVDRWLHAGPDAAWRIGAEADALANVPRVEIADILQRKAAELRRPFLDWAGKLARRNDSPEWWASELAARTSYTRLYERLCTLAATLDALAEHREGTTLVVCGTPALAAEVARSTGAEPPASGPTAPTESGSRALRAWARGAPQPLLELPGRLSQPARVLLDGDPRYRRRILSARGLLEQRPFAGPGTALLFTWIDARSFAADGAYRDPHLGPLAELLRVRGVDVALVPRVLHGLPFAEAVDRLRGSGEACLFPDAYVELGDHRDAAARAASFAPELGDIQVAGLSISALAREHVEEHRSAHAAALVLESLVRRLAGAGVRPQRIVHTCEGHSWELALASAVRRHLPHTTVIGYENLNMSRLALSMFASPAEIGIRPLPDRVVTNGPAYHEVLLSEGWPEALVRAGCGLRHAALWEAEPVRRRPADPLRVFVAGELALGPSTELVRKAAQAFTDDPSIELVVKCHPLLPRAELEQALGSLAARLRFDTRPTTELLREADVLLYTHSAVGFEALALGVPPVFVRSETTLDLDQLEFATELRWEGRTPTQLRAAVTTIAKLDPAALADWRARARAAAARAVAPPRPECVEAFL